jgi:hypothetical protein
MNRILLVVLVAITSLLGLIFYVPVLTRLFHFGPISGIDILYCIAAGIASILWFELVKIISRKTGFQLMR